MRAFLVVMLLLFSGCGLAQLEGSGKTYLGNPNRKPVWVGNKFTTAYNGCGGGWEEVCKPFDGDKTFSCQCKKEI